MCQRRLATIQLRPRSCFVLLATVRNIGLDRERFELVNFFASHHAAVRFYSAEVFIVAYAWLITPYVLKPDLLHRNLNQFAVIQELMAPCPKCIIDKKYLLAGCNLRQKFPRHPLDVEVLRGRLFVRE